MQSNLADDISKQELLENEKYMIEEDPFLLVTDSFLKIRTKSGELKTFRLNKAQKALINVINDCRKRRVPCRILILKSRQIGFSTLSEAIIYALTSQQSNRTSLILADEGGKSNNLYEMTKLYHRELAKSDPNLAPELVKKNDKGLEFAGINSKIIIGTAENPDMANSFTFQYCHLSESALFRAFDEIMGNLLQTVPFQWDSIILSETTARGLNEFYDAWVSAVNGEGDWIPFFVPWFWMDEYSLELRDGEFYPIKGVHFKNMTEEEFLKIEKDAKIKYDLSDEQLNWRRWKIINDCRKDVRLFKREYPGDWEEAFSMSGDKFFDTAIEKQQEYAPLAIGNIIERNMTFEFIPDEYGDVEIYEYPQKNQHYIATMDASEGIGKDDASIFVGNRMTGHTAAIVYGTYTPDQQAQIGKCICNYYNMALAVPETKGYGTQLCNSLRLVYGNVYYRGDKDKEITDDKYGFTTTAVTRPQMIGMMNDEVRLSQIELRATRLLKECKWFVRKFDKEGKVKKIEAISGKQDGLVICRAIFSYINALVKMPKCKKNNNSRLVEDYNNELNERRLGMTSRIGG